MKKIYERELEMQKLQEMQRQVYDVRDCCMALI